MGHPYISYFGWDNLVITDDKVIWSPIENPGVKGVSYLSSKLEKVYNKDGVMVNRTHINTPTYTDSSLTFGQTEFGFHTIKDPFNCKFDYKETLTRKYYDVAEVIEWENSDVPTQQRMAELSGENGYRDMILINSKGIKDDITSANITMKDLTTIEMDLEKEASKTDKNIAETLKRDFTAGRDNYSYYPEKDKYFVYDGKTAEQLIVEQKVKAQAREEWLRQYAESQIRQMEEGTLDVNGQTMTQNNDNNYNSKTTGFTGLELIGIIACVASIGMVVGVTIFMFM